MSRISLTRLNFSSYTYVWLALVVSALIIYMIGKFTNIDIMIEDHYYDAELQKFVWRNSWFAKDLMHGYVKNVIVLIGGLILLLAFLDAVAPWQSITSSFRIRLRFVAWAFVLVPTFISGLKQYFVYHCPSDIDRYGGSAPFIRLFDNIPSNLQAGHCFPAGHASTGLWLAAFCVFYLPSKPKVALRVFFSGLSVGLALGWVQQMRGAHFLFHTLWSVWLASMVIALMLLFTKKLNGI